jgi:hypothetical protein
MTLAQFDLLYIAQNGVLNDFAPLAQNAVCAMQFVICDAKQRVIQRDKLVMFKTLKYMQDYNVQL